MEFRSCKRTFAAGSNIWDSFVTDTISVVKVEPLLGRSTPYYCHKFCVIILLNRKNAPKYIFLRSSKRKFQWVKRPFCVRFQRVFNVFRWNLQRMLPDNLAYFKSFDYFSEKNGWFIAGNSKFNCVSETNQTSNQNFLTQFSQVLRRHR